MFNTFKFYYIIGILFFISISHAVKAVEVNDLYLVKWPVAEQSETARWKATLAGFKEVLIRKSGSHTILDSYEVQQAYRKVTDYLQRFEYSEQDSINSEYPYLVSLYFEPRLIDGIIQDAKMPLWGANRPVTILWIAVEENFKRRILKDNVGNANIQEAKSTAPGAETKVDLSHSIRTNAIRRGLPVISPLMDLEDELVVSISDIWGRFPSTILQASQRYSADSVLVGRVKKEGENWAGDFTYINQSSQSTYQIFADEPQQVIAKMTDKLAELLCSKYCVLEESGKKNQALMNVSGINNFKSFKSVENYLNDLSGVKAASVVKINQHSVLFELTLLGQIESVIEGIRLSQKLRVEEAPKVVEVLNSPSLDEHNTDNLNVNITQEDPSEGSKIDPIEPLDQQNSEMNSVDGADTADTEERGVDDKEESQLQILYYRWIG